MHSDNREVKISGSFRKALPIMSAHLLIAILATIKIMAQYGVRAIVNQLRAIELATGLSLEDPAYLFSFRANMSTKRNFYDACTKHLFARTLRTTNERPIPCYASSPGSTFASRKRNRSITALESICERGTR